MDPTTNAIEVEPTSTQFLKALLYKLIYGGSIVFDLARWLILFLIVFIIFNTFFYSIFIVSGASMYPTFKDKDWIAWDKNIYNNNNPARGDIVVINYPGDPDNKKYVKRIVGLPGDEIEIKEEQVFINNHQLDESYLNYNVGTDPDGTWTLKENQYFVMGDNRPNSNDSRYFGPVEKRFILGKAISRVYPGFRLTKDM